MAVLNMRGSLLLTMLALVFGTAVLSARADEIRLKDGKKLNGEIVGYEGNMFKVKTDFGYVLVEKDKIASIIPAAPTEKPEAQPAAASNVGTSPAPTNTGAKPANPPATTAKTEKAAPKITNVAVKPEVPAPTSATSPGTTAAPAIKGPATAPVNTLTAAAQPPPKPEVPAIREEIQGNLYINYTHGFKMYKAPSWNLIEEARNALPNAIVAMGTNNESTLLVVGEENTKESLEAAAAGVEKRLHDVYSKYQRVSQRKTAVGGLPAVEYQYRGSADDHDWSGRLVVVARGKDVFTVLAMTYADSDLIQIQENVIARSIASLDFNVR